MGDRTILHSDMNCFYASVEHLHRPELNGKPLAVGGDPESRHGIILTADYIAKKYDRINLTLPRGKKAEIQAHAQANGESVNAFIARAIDKVMEEEKRNPPNG